MTLAEKFGNGGGGLTRKDFPSDLDLLGKDRSKGSKLFVLRREGTRQSR